MAVTTTVGRKSFKHVIRSYLVRWQRTLRRGWNNAIDRFRRWRARQMYRLAKDPRWHPILRRCKKWYDVPQNTSFQTIGRCIYCGSNSRLSKEHILAANLGGREVLYKASCEGCRVKTSKIEDNFLESTR